MALQTGDRHIRSVAPMFLDSDATWPCCRCGRNFPRSQSWVVDYVHEDGDPYAFVVCGNCATDLSPVSVVIDLARLEAVSDRSRLAELDSLVRFIAERRQQRDGDEVPIRWMDLDVLASTYRMSVPELVEWLEEQGLARPRPLADDEP